MIAFQNFVHVSGTAGSATFTLPGSAARQLLVAVFAFENVAAASGPIVVNSASPDMGTATEWQRILWQPPSANGGNALEVWGSFWGTGTGGRAVFTGSVPVVLTVGLYTGHYDPGGVVYVVTDGIVRASAQDQWTGDDPECPSVYAFEREMVIGCASHQLQSPGFGTPTPAGWATRDDLARGGSYGNVEAVLADKLTTIEGATGPIPFNATASSGTTKGATATLAVRPVDAAPVATAPLIGVEYAVPL